MRTSSAGHTTNGSHMGSRRRQTRCSRWPSMRAARCPASAPSRFIPAQSSKPGFRVPCRRTRCGQRSRPRARCPPGSSRWAKARRRACGARLRRSSRIAAACTARTATSPSPFLPTIRSRAACGRGHAIRRSRSGCGARARSGPARGSGDDVFTPHPQRWPPSHSAVPTSLTASPRPLRAFTRLSFAKTRPEAGRRARGVQPWGAMSLVLALLGALRAALRTRTDLTLENLALRQQLALLRRRSKRPRVGLLDRVFWMWLSQWWARRREALHVVQPQTVIRWHRQGFRAFWYWKSPLGRIGRPPGYLEISDLGRSIALAIPLWGAPRIHGEL